MQSILEAALNGGADAEAVDSEWEHSFVNLAR